MFALNLDPATKSSLKKADCLFIQKITGSFFFFVPSPLLFNLSLDCMNTSHKISLYADDVLLYISDITDSVKECLKLFDTFGKLSGYKINWNKSILMPLNLDAKSEILTLPTMIPVSDQFNYLGIRVFPSLSRISKWNYQSSLDKIMNDLLCWSPPCLALHGRIATVKMNILLRLSLLFSVLPLTPPTGYFKEIKTAVSKFLWNKKGPRICLKSMHHRLKPHGGLSLPDFWSYYLVYQMRPLRTCIQTFGLRVSGKEKTT
uniref:Reverse transcriptase domain-containing protein n=1 Tax=Cyprinus carpio TaxID=7962 RepID=A0A8C2KWB8_CYPCA